MKNLLITTSAAFIFLIAVSSCCCCHKTAKCGVTKQNPEAQVDYSKEGFTKVTVVKLTLDGCSFLLQLADGKKLEAINLKEEYKKEGLVLWIKYTPNKKAMSICMAGEIVDLTEVKAQ